MDSLTDNMNPEAKKKKGLYPRVISQRTVFLDELLQRATDDTSLSAAEARMAFDTILKQLIKELKQGNSVCLDNVGLFSLTAASRRVQHKEEIRSASIAVKRLAFRMSRAFLKKLGYVEFVRLPAGREK
jgi:predicted histone-like DNA-binding protein